jgi:hypothetical protein
MMRVRPFTIVALTTLVSAGLAGTHADAATAAKPKPPVVYKNCAALNAKYPHGVGKRGAKDKVSGEVVKGKSVTTFKVDDALYKANKKSDRDGDGVACEKK